MLPPADPDILPGRYSLMTVKERLGPVWIPAVPSPEAAGRHYIYKVISRENYFKIDKKSKIRET